MQPFVATAAVGLALTLLAVALPRAQPPRFEAPAVRVAEPQPRALEADWPAPKVPDLRALTPPPLRPLPPLRPIERFEPPSRRDAPAPLAALAGPSPPVLDPDPPPDVVSLLGLRVL